VRNRLERLIGQAREAEQMPWENVMVKLYEKIFPELAATLPEEEGQNYVRQFEQELQRLKAA
jgi:hypothetical protein